MVNYIRNDVRYHVVRYVGTDVIPEIRIGNDVMSSIVTFSFLYVVFLVLSYIISYIFCKPFPLNLLI